MNTETSLLRVLSRELKEKQSEVEIKVGLWFFNPVTEGRVQNPPSWISEFLPINSILHRVTWPLPHNAQHQQKHLDPRLCCIFIFSNCISVFHLQKALVLSLHEHIHFWKGFRANQTTSYLQLMSSGAIGLFSVQWCKVWDCQTNVIHPNIHFCKSLLCSMFNEHTCSRFTWLLFVVVVTMPKLSLKTLKCYIFERPKVRGHQNWYSQPSNTQIQIHKYRFVEVPNICYISQHLLIQGCQKWYSQVSRVIRSYVRSDVRSDIRSDI